VVGSIEMDLDLAAALGDPRARKLLKTVEEFHTYIERNRGFISNDGSLAPHVRNFTLTVVLP
jgi:hypothetical protein